jgi:hypothetical protein
MNMESYGSTISAYDPDGHLWAFMVRDKETLFIYKELESIFILLEWKWLTYNQTHQFYIIHTVYNFRI